MSFQRQHKEFIYNRLYVISKTAQGIHLQPPLCHFKDSTRNSFTTAFMSFLRQNKEFIYNRLYVILKTAQGIHLQPPLCHFKDSTMSDHNHGCDTFKIKLRQWSGRSLLKLATFLLI